MNEDKLFKALQERDTDTIWEEIGDDVVSSVEDGGAERGGWIEDVYPHFERKTEIQESENQFSLHFPFSAKEIVPSACKDAPFTYDLSGLLAISVDKDSASLDVEIVEIAAPDGDYY